MGVIKGETLRRFETYLYIDQKLSKTRAAQNRYLIIKFLTYFAKKPFNRQNFNNLVQSLLNKGYKNGTVNKYIALAKHYDKFIGLNELSDYKYFHQEQYETVPLTPPEIKKLAEVRIIYKKQRNYLNKLYRCLIYFLALTGCRIGEATSLRKKDLFEYGAVFRNTKNGDTRRVPIPKWLYKDLIALNQDNLVFTSYRHKELRQPGINLDLKVRAGKIGLKKRVYCHVFRHSFITEMIRQKVPIVYIAEIVGHRDIGSTQHYTHLVLDDLIEAQNCHPLLRETQTYEDIADRVKKTLQRLINLDVCKFTISENKNKLEVELKKVYSNGR